MGASKYEVFAKVVELGSLTQAAEVLGYTQPGVSHIINAMEEEFGFSLLIRSRHGVRLTADGQRILPIIRQILTSTEQLDQVISAIHGLDAGTVRIGTFTSVAVHWLPGMIKEFQAQYPQIDFALWSGDYHDIERWLAEEQVDIGFVTLPLGNALANSCTCIELHEDRLLAVLPQGHPLSDANVFPLSEIEVQPFIGLLESSDHDVRRIVNMAGVKPDIRFSIKDDYAIVSMVEQGLGISIMPELLLEGSAANVRKVPLENNPTRTIGLALSPGAKASPCVARFSEFVRSWVSQKYSSAL